VQNNLSYTPLEPLSPSGSKPNPNFCDIVNLLFRVFIYVGSMVAVLFLVLGGIGYMVSEVVNKRVQARKRIQSSIYGLLILLCSYLILNTVNPQLVKSCNVLAPTQYGLYTPPTQIQSVYIQNGILTLPSGLPPANEAERTQLISYCTGNLKNGITQTGAGCARINLSQWGDRNACANIPLANSQQTGNYTACIYKE
jgi:hypothetical protein